MTSQPIAFFDFDGTITHRDTFITFGCHALGKVHMAKCIALSSPWLAAWKLGAISNSKAKQKLFGKMFAGTGIQTFRSMGEDFAHTIDNDLRESTLALIEKHKALGHRVVIVSASIADWIRPWAIAHGIDEVIATEAEISPDGILTGRFSTPNCHGPEKVNRILARYPDIKHSETYAYGDSSGDDAMLELVNHPYRII